VAAFSAATAYLLFSLLVTFATPAVGGDGLSGQARPVFTNLLLYAAFGLHHSLFAREGVRARVRRTLSTRTERTAYVWSASILLVVMCWLWAPVPGVAWDTDGAWRVAFRVAQLAGLALVWRSIATIDGLELVGLRQLTQAAPPARERLASPLRELSAPSLRIEGPYRWIRHPMHAGVLLMVAALPTMTMTQLTFALASTAYVLAAIPFEERSLRRLAPDAYDAYARRVRWRLLPRVY
jgi:protein-S-isoprenylcysteine O-methyltransferase Ste14